MLSVIEVVDLTARSLRLLLISLHLLALGALILALRNLYNPSILYCCLIIETREGSLISFGIKYFQNVSNRVYTSISNLDQMPVKV